VLEAGLERVSRFLKTLRAPVRAKA
jgi:hypothetical protein